MTERLRDAVRALVLDDDERVLLRFELPKAFEPVPALTRAELNAEFVTAVCWWTLEELEAAEGEFAPRRFPLLARDLILNGPPALPIDVGV